MEHLNIEKFREIYAEWQASGQSIRTFTSAMGIEESKFYYWQRKLRKSTAVALTGSNTGFIPIGKPGYRQPSRCGSIANPTPALCEVVYPNGVMIRITSDLSVNDLQSLIFLSK